MSDNQNHNLTLRFHTILWWVTILIFAALTMEQFFPMGFGDLLPFIGVLFLVGATIYRALVLAVDFSRLGEKKNVILSLALIGMIGLAALAGVLI